MKTLLLNLILFSAFHGFILSIIIFTKRKNGNSSNLIFAAILFLFSLYLFEFYSAFNGIWPPKLTFLTYPSLFFIGPLFYLYQSSLKGEKLERRTKAKHLLPGLLVYLAFVPFYILNMSLPLGSCPLAWMTDNGLSYINYLITPGLFHFYSLIFIVYSYVSFSSTHKKELLQKRSNNGLFETRGKWLKKLLFVLISFFLFSSIIELSGVIFPRPYSEVYPIVQNVVLSLIILGIGYWAFVIPAIFSEVKQIRKGVKYETSSLSNSAAKEMASKIIDYMEKEKPYLEEDISIQFLSDALGIPKHHISQVVNQELNLSFSFLINQYRIKEAKRLLSQASNKLTVFELAYRVGFNNKVSFYRAFKNSTGESFSDFKKRL